MTAPVLTSISVEDTVVGASVPQAIEECATEEYDSKHYQKIVQGLAPPQYDYIGLGYTGANLTTVTYKAGGSGGETVATLTLAYTGSQLDSVTKS